MARGVLHEEHAGRNDAVGRGGLRHLREPPRSREDTSDTRIDARGAVDRSGQGDCRAAHRGSADHHDSGGARVPAEQRGGGNNNGPAMLDILVVGK